ncbi:DUF6264 family protein [Agromyces sp. G08B096]|uniref:DUF6264 family protein n=1 Tax=Agromyces sp. G08B096 TaxID=3156399 RepID=A0AAU7WAE2_9MICO
MSQDEAARTPDASADGTPPGGGPADERPRPRYGEYAPPGWSWQPPAERESAAEPATPPTAAPAASGFPDGAPAAHPVDRGWTIALLVFGALGALYNAFSLLVLPQSVLESARLSAAVLGTEPPASFTPGPVVPVAIGLGVALQLGLWLGALLWSRARMRQGRLAWWVPVLAGVAAFIVVLVVGMVVFASDPEFYRTLSSVPTPAP